MAGENQVSGHNSESHKTYIYIHSDCGVEKVDIMIIWRSYINWESWLKPLPVRGADSSAMIVVSKAIR